MVFRNTWVAGALLMLLSGLWACNKSEAPAVQQASLQLSFSNVVNGQPMTLGNATYVNAAGESFNITTFKYYVSNFSLINAAGQEVKAAEQYVLVNEADAASRQATLQLPEGTYQGISFLIGVDSVRNFSGAQTGALDPVNGMFWTWNSGYIMAKLEGSSPASAHPTKLIEFHIGGFKAPYNALRRVQLTFPQPIRLTADSIPVVPLVADAYTWFDQPHRIRFQEMYSCHTPSEEAVQVADNYQRMFSIKPD